MTPWRFGQNTLSAIGWRRSLLCLGFSEKKRDFVGRWRVVTASDEYVRTAQYLITTLQEEALRGLLKDERRGLRNGGLDSLQQFLVSRRVPPQTQVETLLGSLQTLLGSEAT